MYTLIIVLTVLVSILLIIVVLVQKSKGGGLSSSFAGSNQIMGVRRTNDFIEKATWTLAGIICVLSILSVFVMPRNVVQSAARVKPVEAPVVNTDFQTPAPAAAPVAEEAPAAEAPAAAPAAEEAPAQ
ncbi:MAG: preprotein translocase subunit SecG [Muribaculaceae bacterium]|nr:preprotein translocase subunit SecG [Muribaculaceae bacterium]MDE7142414.1 preprotein translocase subunit SecG [Muribaculaceae bacterium]